MFGFSVGVCCVDLFFSGELETKKVSLMFCFCVSLKNIFFFWFSFFLPSFRSWFLVSLSAEKRCKKRRALFWFEKKWFWANVGGLFLCPLSSVFFCTVLHDFSCFLPLKFIEPIWPETRVVGIEYQVLIVWRWESTLLGTSEVEVTIKRKRSTIIFPQRFSGWRS